MRYRAECKNRSRRPIFLVHARVAYVNRNHFIMARALLSSLRRRSIQRLANQRDSLPTRRASRLSKGMVMKQIHNERGATGWILLWLIGIPVPLLLLFFVLRGCT
jgi:hypothetical protein